MIPKILHYCFGLTPDFGGKPWSLVHHACLTSAIERIKPEKVNFYCEYEPQGAWWEITRPLVTLQRIQAPQTVFGRPLLHPAHRADVVRLQRLIEEGGIYLDADVFVHKSFDDLLHHSTVLGHQIVEGKLSGLCNAVILAEPHALFLERWYSEYKTFRSQGRDEFWDEHAVTIPLRLAQENPELLTILDHKAFFWPTYRPDDLKLIFESRKQLDLPSAYATHLWETPAWESYLEQLTPGEVRRKDTNFHRWARPFVSSLPADFGRAAISDRLTRGVRSLRRRLKLA